jgi:hypothetical protein
MRVRKPGFLNAVFQQNKAHEHEHGLMMGDDESCAFSNDGMPPVGRRAPGSRDDDHADDDDDDDDDADDSGADDQQQQNGEKDDDDPAKAKATSAAAATPEQAPRLKKARAKSLRNLFSVPQPSIREEEHDDGPSGGGNKSSLPEVSSPAEGNTKKEKKGSSHGSKKESAASGNNTSKKDNVGKKQVSDSKKTPKKSKPKPKSETGAAAAASAPPPQPPPGESVLSWSRQASTKALSALSSPRPRFTLGIGGGREKNNKETAATEDSAAGAGADTATQHASSNNNSKLKIIPPSAPLPLKLKAAVTKSGGGQESASFVQFTIGQTDVDAVSHVSDDAYSSSSSSDSSDGSESSENSQSSMESELQEAQQQQQVATKKTTPRRGGRRRANQAAASTSRNRKKDNVAPMLYTADAAAAALASARREQRKEHSTSSRGSSYSEDGPRQRKETKSAEEKKKDSSMSSRGKSYFDNAAAATPKHASPPTGKEKKKDSSNTKPHPAPSPIPSSSTSQRSKDDSSKHNYTEEFLMQSMLKALAEETGEDISELAKKAAGIEKKRTDRATPDGKSSSHHEVTHRGETGTATTVPKRQETKPENSHELAQLHTKKVSDSPPNTDTIVSTQKQQHQDHHPHPLHHDHQSEPNNKVQTVVGKEVASHNHSDGSHALQTDDSVHATKEEKDTPLSESVAEDLPETSKTGSTEISPSLDVNSKGQNGSTSLKLAMNNGAMLTEPSIEDDKIDQGSMAVKEAEPERSERNASANDIAAVSYLPAEMTGPEMKVDVVGDGSGVTHETGHPMPVHQKQSSHDHDTHSPGSVDRHSISSREKHREKSVQARKVNGPNKPTFSNLAELIEKDKPTLEEEVMKILNLTEKKKVDKGPVGGSVEKRKNTGRPGRQKSMPAKKVNGPSSELSSNLTHAHPDARSSLFRSMSDRKLNLDKALQSPGISATSHHGHVATGTTTTAHSPVGGSGAKNSDGMMKASSVRHLFESKGPTSQEHDEQQSITPIWKISNPKIREALGLDQTKSENEQEKNDDNVIDVEKAMQERPEKSGKVRSGARCIRRKSPREPGPPGSQSIETPEDRVTPEELGYEMRVSSMHETPSVNVTPPTPVQRLQTRGSTRRLTKDDEPSEYIATPEELGYEMRVSSLHANPSMPAMPVTPATPVQRLNRRGSTRAITKEDRTDMPQAPMTPVRHRMSRRGSTGDVTCSGGTDRPMRNLVQARTRTIARDASPANIHIGQAKKEPVNQSQAKRVSTPVRMRRRLSLAETGSSISDQLVSAFAFPSVDEPSKAEVPAALPIGNTKSAQELPLRVDTNTQGDEKIQPSKVEEDLESLDGADKDDDDDERIQQAVAQLFMADESVVDRKTSESSNFEGKLNASSNLLDEVGIMVDSVRNPSDHPACLPTPVRVNPISLRSALETPTNMMMDIRTIKMAEAPFVSIVGMSSKDQEKRVAEERTEELAAQTLGKMILDESARDAVTAAAATDNKKGSKLPAKYPENLPKLYARMTSELVESTTRLNKAKENVSVLEAEVKDLQLRLRALQQHKWNL